jgi:hypothetical protein
MTEEYPFSSGPKTHSHAIQKISTFQIFRDRQAFFTLKKGDFSVGLWAFRLLKMVGEPFRMTWKAALDGNRWVSFFIYFPKN